MARRTTTLAGGFFFLDGLRWHADRLWAADVFGGAVHRFAADGTSEVAVPVPGEPGGLGWLPDGRLLVVSRRGRRILRQDGGRFGAGATLVEHASLAHLPGVRLQDMFVDGAGRAWVGDVGFDLDAVLAERGQVGLMGPGTPPSAVLARVDPDGSVHVAAEGLELPGGIGLLPGGQTLIVAQVVGMSLVAFDVGAAGELVNRQVWAPTTAPSMRAMLRSRGPAGRLGRWLARASENTPFAGRTARSPHGICVDAEGAIWVANARAPEVVCVGQGGRVLERVRTSQHAYSCALGGPEGTTLYVSTAPTSVREHARQLPLATIEAIEVDVPAAGPGPAIEPKPRLTIDWATGPPTGQFTLP